MLVKLSALQTAHTRFRCQRAFNLLKFALNTKEKAKVEVMLMLNKNALCKQTESTAMAYTDC